VVFSFGAYYYHSQNNIYIRSISFQNKTDDMNSAGGAIASLLGEKSSGLTVSEVTGLVYSIDYRQLLAIKVHSHPDLYNLDISSISSNQKFDMRAFLSRCDGVEKCRVKILRDVVSGMVKVNENAQIDNKYDLEIIGLDSKTNDIILGLAVEAIRENRVNMLKKQINDQLKLSEDLSKKKKDELNEIDIDQLRDDKNNFKDKIRNIESKIFSYNNIYQKHKLDLSYMETRFKNTKDISNKSINQSDVRAGKKRKKLQAKIEKIQNDVSAIRFVTESLSGQDKVILRQLNLELKKVQDELNSMGNRGRTVSSQQRFVATKEGEKNYTEFDYKVQKEQFKKIEKDYKKLMKEKKVLLSESLVTDTKLDKLSPSFEYLKLLESKVVQLKLLESTVVSDLIFENEFNGVRRYKKTTKSKVIVFAFFLSFSCLVIIIFFLYLFDDRIYDQYELEKSFEELSVIGNTPDFD
jgi:hypothetical protein